MYDTARGGRHRTLRLGRRRNSVPAALVGLAGLAAGALLALYGPAQAATAFTNGSFENGSYAGGNWNTLATNSTAIDGWTVTAGTVDWVSSAYWQAADGTKSVDMDGDSAGALSQSFSTTAGATYSVKFALSGNPDGGPGTKTLQVSASSGQSQTFTYQVTSATTKGDMNYAAEEFTFTAASGTTSTTLTFASQTPGAYGPVLDNVTVTGVYTSGSQCKHGGWQTMIDPSTGIAYKNQGQCVSHFATNGDTPIGS